VQAVLRYVRQFGENGVMHSKVMRGVHFGAKRIGEAIQTLKERDQIESWSGKGGATFYRTKKGGKR